MSWTFKDKSNLTVDQITQKRHLDSFFVVVVVVVLLPLQGYFTILRVKGNIIQQITQNNSKEAFRVQKRNEKIIIIFFFFCGFGITTPSGLFH